MTGQKTMFRLAKRLLTEPDKRVLAKFAYGFGWKGTRAVKAFHKRRLCGEYFPPFLFFSITNRCNLRCRGCWVSADRDIDFPPDKLDGVITESKERGTSFFGLLGGEPFLYEEMFDVISRHPDAYFLVFTNGTLLTRNHAEVMRTLGNVTPMISIEGLPEATRERRGSRDIFDRSVEALEICRDARLITGVATSICANNIDDLADEKFLNDLVRRGVMYMWYYIYRPAGPDPAPELALSREQITRLRRFMVEARMRVPMVIVDGYWDERGNAVCPSRLGIGHHINSSGDLEPCPPIQWARDNVLNGKGIYRTFTESEFIKAYREFADSQTPGCVLMESPGQLLKFMQKQEAWDSSGRNAGAEELARLKAVPSQHIEEEVIPERSYFYRFAKRNWFFGFGAYG